MSSPAVIGPSPFLKWAGGKRSQLPFLRSHIGQISGRYFEPFLGGGAALFGLAPSTECFAGDLNSDLIATYETVRDAPQELIEIFKDFHNEKEFYLQVRSWDRDPSFVDRPKVEKAARFIYLNRTGFNGLYRVNSRGEFNVPFGRQSYRTIADYENLVKVSQFLKGELQSGTVTLFNGSYLDLCAQAQEGDTVYLDPPYDPLSASSSFVSYQKDGFTRKDQEDLRDEVLRLASIGCKVFVSNSSSEYMHKLYGDRQLFQIHRVMVPRQIGAQAQSRSSVEEILVEARNRG